MSSSQSSALEQRFELTKRDSTVRKEIVAGLTMFFGAGETFGRSWSGKSGAN